MSVVETERQQQENFYVTVGDQRLWVSIRDHKAGQGRGQGVPLLLIMGFGGNLQLWQPFREALGSYETVAFDLPGVGRSPAGRTLTRAPAVAARVEKMLDTLGYDELDVLGVSLGGGLAQELAHRLPKRVRKLVLCSTAAGAFGVPAGLPAIIALANLRRGGLLSPASVRTAVFGGASLSGKIGMEQTMRTLMGGLPTFRGSLSQLYAVSTWTSLPWLRSLTQPTLVMSGDDDHVVPLPNARFLKRMIPQARLYVVPGAGHLFLGTHADEAAAVIRDFLTS